MKKTSINSAQSAKSDARFFRGRGIHDLIWLGIGLVVCGLIVLFKDGQLANNFTSSSASIVFASAPDEVKKQPISGIPTFISVSSVGINNLVVAEGKYSPTTKQWTLSNDKAHFAEISTPANDTKGNTFIYGHYRPGVFVNLKKLKTDDLAVVKTDNNRSFVYKFRTSVTVQPNDASTFAHKGTSILTLQTCTGAFFQNRQLYIFDFVEVK